MCRVGDREIFDGLSDMPLSGFRPLAHAVNAHMRGDLIEPALQRCRVPQRVALPVGADQGFLRQVLRLGCISYEIPDVSRQSPPVLLNFFRSTGRRSHVCSLLPNPDHISAYSGVKTTN